MLDFHIDKRIYQKNPFFMGFFLFINVFILSSCVWIYEDKNNPTYIHHGYTYEINTNIEELEREFWHKTGGATNTIYFDHNVYDLNDRSKFLLLDQINWLLKNPEYYIVLEGHCDDRGSDDYNLALGYRRSESVKQFLIEKGIAENRIEVVSHGENSPKALGNGELVRSQNRRVVTIIPG